MTAADAGHHLEPHAPAWRDALSGDALRERTVDLNDGVVAAAGIVEGFAGAGITGSTMLLAGFTALVAGAMALGTAQYSEAAAARDRQRAVIDAERREIQDFPDDELAELARLYEARGLSPELAAQVARELMAGDALAAQLEVEHGITAATRAPAPLPTAVLAGLAFAVGALIPVMSMALAPAPWRIGVTFAVVVAALCVTGVLAVGAGRSVWRAALRTVVLGIVTMLLTLGIGSLLL